MSFWATNPGSFLGELGGGFCDLLKTSPAQGLRRVHPEDRPAANFGPKSSRRLSAASAALSRDGGKWILPGDEEGSLFMSAEAYSGAHKGLIVPLTSFLKKPTKWLPAFPGA